MEDKIPTKPKIYTCPECMAGRMRETRVVYYTWLARELITVPDFPAWVCDICGRCDYDPKAVSWINTLLNSGRRGPKPASSQKPTSPDQPSAQVG
jgi:YgiT-type zinc finger domain-containing protein